MRRIIIITVIAGTVSLMAATNRISTSYFTQWLASNQFAEVYTFTNITCDITSSEHMTNMIKRLAEKGHICRQFGHNWRVGRPGEVTKDGMQFLYSDYHPNVQYRICRICGKCESQRLEWK
jgi:hypothetical protein